MSNTSQIPEGDQDLVADFMARFTKESASLIEADFLAEFDIRFSVENESYRLQLTRVNNSPSQKNIKVLEQTIQDQDRQILELKDVIQAARLALKEISTGTDFPLSVAQNALQVIFTYLNKK